MTDTIIIREDLPIEVTVLGPPGPQGEQGEDGASNISGLPISIPAVTTGGVVDNAAAINASLANAAHSITMLPAGVIGVGRSIRIPSGKTLRGAGRGRTTILALASFNRLLDVNAVVVTDNESVDIAVEDLLIDANEVGIGLGTNERIGGLHIEGTTNFSVSRVDVQNCTEYGHLARGDANAFTFFASGNYFDCVARNCEITFEAMACNGVSYAFCRAEDGDGTIATQSWFHPLTGSRNITYYRCSGTGEAGSGAEITANLEPQFNITFIGCELEITGGAGIGIVSNGAEGTRRLNLIASRFASGEYIGANLEYSAGKIVGCTFEGISIGLAFDAQSGSFDWDVSNTDVFGVPETGDTGTGILAEGGANVRWSGGRIEIDTAAAGSSAAPISRGAGSTVTVSPETRIAPIGDVDGGGFTFNRLLPAGGASSASTTGTTVVVGTGYEWTFPVKAGRRYFCEILNGAWLHASTASNGRLGVQGAGGAAGSLLGELWLNTSPTARTSKVINGIAGVGTAGSMVEASMPSISEYLPFGGSFVFACTNDGTLSIEIGTSNASHAMSLLGFARLSVREI